MKKQVRSILLALFMVLVLLPKTARATKLPETSGSLGNGLTWNFDKNTGVLTVSGSGSMPDFEWDLDRVYGWKEEGDHQAWQELVLYAHGYNTEWQEHDEYKIRKVVIQDGVTNIGAHAFSEMFALESVIIPNSVTAIGECAFLGAPFEAITIPNSVTRIDYGAFYECYNLKSIVLPNTITDLGNSIFLKCQSLESVILPNTLTRIGDCMFAGCKKLTNMTIPDTVTSIGYDAFNTCALNPNIPSGLTELGSGAFAASGLKGDVVIPDGITELKSGVFERCTQITSITIPQSVTCIGFGAFWQCDELKDVYYTGSVEQWEKIEIQQHPQNPSASPNTDLIEATKHFNYVGEQKQPAPPTDKLTASPTSSKVLVNGEEVVFDAYNINNNNYFKLRDLAYILNGTAKQFEITWDKASNSIALTSGKTYTVVGGEMTSKGSEMQTAAPTTSKIMLDGKEISLAAYNINGNNYFKLRDIGAAFDFGTDWDGTAKTILIDTSKSYTTN